MANVAASRVSVGSGPTSTMSSVQIELVETTERLHVGELFCHKPYRDAIWHGLQGWADRACCCVRLYVWMHGRRCAVIYYHCRARQQVSCFSVLTRWPGTKKGHSPSRKGENSNGASVSVCARVCKSVSFSCLRKDTRNQAALSQPSVTIAPQCCAYVRNGMRWPFPLNVSTGCRSHTVPPRRLIMNDWLINRDY